MPLPRTKNVGKLMSFLHKENEDRPKDKKWSHKQMVAISMKQAQKSGADFSKDESYIADKRINEMTSSDTLNLSDILNDGSSELAAISDAQNYYNGQRDPMYQIASSGSVVIKDIPLLIKNLKLSIKDAEKQGDYSAAENFSALVKWLESHHNNFNEFEESMNTNKEMRDFIKENIILDKKILELKKELRKNIEEMTTSGNIAIGPNVEQSGKMTDVIPAGVGDQAEVELPDDINTIDIENPDSDEDENDELEKLSNEAEAIKEEEEEDYYNNEENYENDSEEDDENDAEEEDEGVSDEELVQQLSDMDEEELDELVGSLSDEEKESLSALISSVTSQETNENEIPSDEIIADQPAGIGQEDENDGMIQVGDSLEDSPSKQRTVNQIEIDQEEENPQEDNVSPGTPSISDNESII